jgi:lipoprotein-releasing system permease protein
MINLFKNYKFFTALKYLKSRRKEKFISLITLISISGVILGVATLIIVISVMNGFEKQLRDKILGVNAHIVVVKLGENIKNVKPVINKIKKVKGVTGVAPFIYQQAMLSNGDSVSGVVVRGVDLNYDKKVTIFSKSIIKGSDKCLFSKEENCVIVGKELAKNIGVTVGDSVNLVSPFGRMTPMGMIPKMKKFIVGGIFATGMYDYDSTLCYISINSAQKFFNMKEEVTGIEVKVNNIYNTKKIAKKIKILLNYPYWVRDWMEMNKNLFSALKLEQVTMFIILTLIVFVAAFNIASTLIMMVMEKNRDIAILKAIGAKRKDIMHIFMYQGIIIGFFGTFIGSTLGIIICLLLKKYKFINLPKDVYYISTLPVELNMLKILIIVSASLVICFLGTIYPAWQASKLKPSETLRYE